jgi:hypothetical protein
MVYLPLKAAAQSDTGDLTAFNDPPKDAIAELTQRGIIPPGGRLIFNMNYTYYSGKGFNLIPIATNAARANIVLAAQMTAITGDPKQLEMCSLAARVGKADAKGRINTYMSAGFSNRGELTVIDRPVLNDDPTTLLSTPLNLDLSQPHHLLLVLLDNKLTIYVDGKRVTQDVAVIERLGSYGLLLAGAGAKARCEARNLWAYQIASPSGGTCIANAPRDAIKRAQPSTKADDAGQLRAGKDTLVMQQTKGDDGRIWWGFEDGTWVREDVVRVTGDCENIPITP